MAEPEKAAKTAKKKPDQTCETGNCPPPKKKAEGDFEVDQGQLTFDSEGNEGGRYHSRHAHWPGGKSGVTLGRGYDMGDRTSAQVKGHLTGAGVDPATADKYAAGAGLKGADAGKWVTANRDSIPEITPAQQKSLFGTTYREQEAEARRVATKDDVTKKYGATCWENLDPKIKDTLVDLKYRGDYTPASRGFLQDSVANNDPAAFGAAMRNQDNWGSVPADRFTRRSNFWK